VAPGGAAKTVVTNRVVKRRARDCMRLLRPSTASFDHSLRLLCRSLHPDA
jgi:hypothetical protein